MTTSDDDWSPPEEIIRWTATRPDGTVLSQVDIRFEGRENLGPSRYSVRAGYDNGMEAVLLQRTFSVPAWQSLNVAGLTAAALLGLGYEHLVSDDWPEDQYERSGGTDTAIPREVIERFKRQ